MGSAESLPAMVRGHHRHLRGLLGAVSSADPGEGRSFDDLRRYLAMHEAAEQVFLHPLALLFLPETGAVERRIGEEREIAGRMRHLEHLDAKSLDHLIQAGLLEEVVLAHNDLEESEELDLLVDVLDPELAARACAGLARVDATPDVLAGLPADTSYRRVLARAIAVFRAGPGPTTGAGDAPLSTDKILTGSNAIPQPGDVRSTREGDSDSGGPGCAW